jgi:predicted PurR-regulated permease PerM
MHEHLSDLSPPWRRLLLVMAGAASTVVVVAGVHAVAGLVTPVLLAGFLALLLQPLLRRLCGVVGAALAVSLVALLVVLGGLAMAAVVGASLHQLALELPRYQDEIRAFLQGIGRSLTARGIDAGEFAQSLVAGPPVGRTLLNVWSSLVGAAEDLLVTYVVFAFMLGGMTGLERRASRHVGDDSPLLARFFAYSDTIRGYMGVRTVLGLAVALLQYVLLVVVGVAHAPLWAVSSFLLSFVPNIGFVLALVPPSLLAVLGLGWRSGLVVLLGYVAINTLVDDVIGARYLGHRMKISSLLTFLSVLFWTWLLGAIGAFLAVPLTVLVKSLAFSAPTDFDATPPDAAEGSPPRGTR